MNEGRPTNTRSTELRLEFPMQEYQRRILKAREFMASVGIDCLLLTSNRNIRYFTGFYTQAWINSTRPRFFLLPLDKEPIAILPSGEPVGFRKTSWVTDIRTWPAPRPKDEGVNLVVDTLRSLVKSRAHVGAEIGAEMRLEMPVMDFLRIRDAVDDIAFVDASPVVRSLRMVKSPSEVACIRQAAQIVSKAFAQASELLTRGQSEEDVYHIFYKLLVELRVETAPYLIPVSGPCGYDQIIVGPTDRVLQFSDLLMIDVSASWHGYFCDIDRNFAVGSSTPENRQAYSRVYEATQAGIDAVRPNSTVADVWRAMTKVLTHDGYFVTPSGRMGHGLGLDPAEPPSLSHDDHTILEEGMVLAIEPGPMWFGTGGGQMMVHEENVVVTQTGCELLSVRAEATLPVVDASNRP